VNLSTIATYEARDRICDAGFAVRRLREHAEGNRAQGCKTSWSSSPSDSQWSDAQDHDLMSFFSFFGRLFSRFNYKVCERNDASEE
jgi:hypothetical protein